MRKEEKMNNLRKEENLVNLEKNFEKKLKNYLIIDASSTIGGN
jgi:hypothetical protein